MYQSPKSLECSPGQQRVNPYTSTKEKEKTKENEEEDDFDVAIRVSYNVTSFLIDLYVIPKRKLLELSKLKDSLNEFTCKDCKYLTQL